MITASITFNGEVVVRLTGATGEDKQILALVFGGRSVTEIRPESDGAITLMLTQSEKQKKEAKS